MLRLLVHRGLMEEETARGMLAWPHSGFHVHDGVWVAAHDCAFARLARYCGRNPVALGGLAYRSDTGAVTYQSDRASGPTPGAETLEALEFLARVVSHIPTLAPGSPPPLAELLGHRCRGTEPPPMLRIIDEAGEGKASEFCRSTQTR